MPSSLSTILYALNIVGRLLYTALSAVPFPSEFYNQPAFATNQLPVYLGSFVLKLTQVLQVISESLMLSLTLLYGKPADC
jgi:hypothetical protein